MLESSAAVAKATVGDADTVAAAVDVVVGIAAPLRLQIS